MSKQNPEYHREGRAMLERIRAQDGRLQVVQIKSAGARHHKVLEHLIARDLAEIVDHPTVVDRRRGIPAQAVAITDAGRRILDKAS
jgi:hypothetical protein